MAVRKAISVQLANLSDRLLLNFLQMTSADTSQVGNSDAERRAILSAVAGIVKSKDPQAIIYLFGSRARMDYHDDSDWDFFIATSKSDHRKFEDVILDSVYDVMLEYDELIQILAYPRVSWEKGLSPSPIYDNIRKEGIEL